MLPCFMATIFLMPINFSWCVSCINRILQKELRCEVPVALSQNGTPTNWAVSFYAWMAVVLWLATIGESSTCFKKAPKRSVEPINYCVRHTWTGNQLLLGMKIQGMLFSEQQGLWSVVMELWKDSAVGYPSTLESGKILVSTHTRVLRESMINW